MEINELSEKVLKLDKQVGFQQKLIKLFLEKGYSGYKSVLHILCEKKEFKEEDLEMLVFIR